MNRVFVNPTLLRWARKRADFTQEDLKQRFKNLADWESGKIQPTFKQLEKFAQTVHVPFGYLFLPEPPTEHLPIADFRSVSDSAKSKISPNLIDTLHTMHRRQAWLRDYLIDNEMEPLGFVKSAYLSDSPKKVGRKMREIVGLSDGWASTVRTWEQAVNELRRMIEQLGVMAVINGIVGNNTRRKLDINEFRGFALIDAYAPLIFVNGADTKSAQMFTLAHELAHIWLGLEGLSRLNNLLPNDGEEENWCNQVAAEFLVPANEMLECWNRVDSEQNRFDVIARSFKVSPLVAARRSLDLNLIEREEFLKFYKQHIKQREHINKKGSGGNFYNTQNVRVGAFFATHVIGAAIAGQIGFKEAYELTGLQGGTFQNYAKQLEFVLP